MKTTNPICRLMAALLLLMLVSPLYAQEEKADSVFSFRFFSGRNQFYVPFIDNGKELTRLLDCVGRYKEAIMDHPGSVHVDGYCDSRNSEKANLALAKIRSNRVKSEMITRRGLTEACFSTRNHSGGGNYVTVNIRIPKDDIIPKPQEPEKVETPVETVAVEPIEVIEEFTIDEPAQEPVEEIVPEENVPVEIADTVVAGHRRNCHLALKTNLLDYAILMPNLEIEWMCARRWSVALEWQGAWYAKENPHKVYRVSMVIPEVRYWPIEHKEWHGMYAGVFVGGGLYDLSAGKHGHEGEGILAGVSAGYMWPISRYFSLDAGLGVGYMRLRDKEYAPLHGHFLYLQTKYINYVGPLRLKLSLAWRF